MVAVAAAAAVVGDTVIRHKYAVIVVHCAHGRMCVRMLWSNNNILATVCVYVCMQQQRQQTAIYHH